MDLALGTKLAEHLSQNAFRVVNIVTRFFSLSGNCDFGRHGYWKTDCRHSSVIIAAAVVE